MRTFVVLGVALGALAVLACAREHHGQKSEQPAGAGGEGPTTCASFVGQLTDCGVLTGTRFKGCEDDHPLLPCMAACVTDYGCDQVAGMYCYGSFNDYASCLEACRMALPPPEFVCGDGSRILASWRCDGSVDCPGGEDEACPDGKFTCGNGLEIPAGWVCDGVQDCQGGNEDERDCGPMISCDDGTSLPASLDCDGTPDCPGGEDERDCAKLMCE
jgi:hypothetical protein